MYRQKHRWIYDLESYPNFFSAVFKNEKSKEVREFTVFADTEDDSYSTNDTGDMVDFVEREVQWLIGYNNAEFDDILLANTTSQASRLRNAHPRTMAYETNVLVEGIIRAQHKDSKAPEYYALSRMPKQWRSLDLIQIFNPVDRVGLKRLAIILRWPTIEDLPIKPGSIIKREDIPRILSYQHNDVAMTERVKQELAPAINNRIAYTIKFGTDLINSSNSAIGRQIMADLYCKHLDVDFSQIKNLSTEYEKLELRDCISPKVHFITKEYNKILQTTRETIIDPRRREDHHMSVTKKGKLKKTRPQFELTVRSKYLYHTMMLGGVHSNGPAEILEENDDYAYIDLDVAGYYPRLICNEDLYPAHLNPRFTPLFEEHVVNERARIKKLDAVLAYMLKIAANAAFGLTDVKGESHSWLKDPRMAKYITISGQLFLFMLMEALELYSSCIVVYSNTDGLTVRVLRKELSLFYTICKRWELYTNFELEFNSYRKMIIRDVNNYLIFVNTTDESKRIKAKGVYQYENLMGTELKVKGVSYPIIAMAVREWYDKNIPVKDTILGSKTIYDFVKAENTSPAKFDVILYPNDTLLPTRTMQKNNRWIVTKGNPGEGRMVKISKEDGEKTEMQKGFYITPVNDIDESRLVESYQLNYDFYINQAQALINLTKPLNKETHIPPMIQATMAF